MKFTIRTRVLAGLAASALLSGCISFGPDLPPSLLTLTATATTPAGSVTSGNQASALAVLEPETAAKLNNTRVPVQVTDTEVAFLQEAIWVEKPSRLFRRLLAETIRARSGRVVVDGDASAVVPGSILRGYLREFGYDARQSAVIVRFDAVRTGEGGAIQTRRFESVVPGIPAQAAPVGDALNRAANDVAAQVAEWMG